ncbi:hypothetical protein [Nostoc sp. GT001]|uniref:hypothetical protein n=1 Tax=Nostoc sp. GT001 TaxID=3056647 RepID=UPI0025AADB05|nr:hypothetical protein [Nostoc sp. GT001]MDM9582865.1 hypothetical protein [Nostoc sp. GT001]
MSKLVKRGCIALLAGTAISMTMGVQGAKADQYDYYDDVINECNRVYQLRSLTPQEIEICNLAVRYKQNQILRDYQLELLRQHQENMEKLLETPATLEPTDFGFGNNKN